MDTELRLPERDRSPGPEKGPGERSRSARFRAALLETGRRRGTWLALGTPLLLALLVNAVAVQPFLIPSGSMSDTLRPGDRVLVNKLAYAFGDEPRRGDVVVFDGSGTFSPEQDEGSGMTGSLRELAAAAGLAEPAGTNYIKRVIGVGGDRVMCCDTAGRVRVNGEPLAESGYLHPGDAPSTIEFDVVVPEGRLWLMGDHRYDSSDSRAHLGSPGGGTVAVGKVIGRADWIGWPLERITSVERAAYGR